MRLESIQLFERLERAKDENAITEALAACLRISPEFQKRFLQKASVDDQITKIETQQQDAKSKKRLDLEVSCDSALLLFEIKEQAPLHYSQWKNYKEIARDRNQDPNRSVFAILAPWANPDDKIEPKENIWRWSDIYEMACGACVLEKESNKVGSFLLNELMVFLEERGMKPFDGFTQQDIDTINRIPDAGKKLRNFLEDVFNNLSKSPNKSVLVQKGTVEVKTYKDYPEVYAWVSFKVISKLARAKTLNVWFGIQEYQSNGPILALGVWTTNRMWSSEAERQRWQKKLRGLGFTWDETGEGGFVKPLKTELKSSESDPNLLENIVQKIEEVAAKVYDRL